MALVARKMLLYLLVSVRTWLTDGKHRLSGSLTIGAHEDCILLPEHRPINRDTLCQAWSVQEMLSSVSAVPCKIHRQTYTRHSSTQTPLQSTDNVAREIFQIACTVGLYTSTVKYSGNFHKCSQTQCGLAIALGIEPEPSYTWSHLRGRAESMNELLAGDLTRAHNAGKGCKAFA
ncbi:hypothetical protein CBL_13427 [Carabus blaptoides fortunei]